MIQKIGFTPNVNNNATSNFKTKNHKNDINKTSSAPTVSQSPLNSEFFNNYYVSFTGKKERDAKNYSNDLDSKRYVLTTREKLKEIEENTSYHGEKLLNDSKNLAKKYNHPEITQVHVLRVGLQNLVDYIDGLNSGEIDFDDETSFSIPDVIETFLGDDVFEKKEKRNEILPTIKNEIVYLDKILEQTPPSSINTNRNPVFSKDFLNDIYAFYQQDKDAEGASDSLVHDLTFFNVALFPSNDKIKKEIVVPFRTKLKDAINLDKRPLSKRTHLSFYDEKAKNIWKNLAVGTNMVILHDKDTRPSYLINSFLHIFDKAENGFGKLNKKNTEIINFNDTGTIDAYYIRQKLQPLGKNKDKNYIVVMSIMDTDLNALALDGTNVDSFKKTPPNVKFVMVADKDKYYNQNTGNHLEGFFDDFGEVSMPLMNATQAKKMFLEQPKLMERVKKPFTKQAIEQSVDLANQLPGTYPEKAKKVMDLVAAYYVDKDKITLSDVQDYAKEAKEIFKPVENDTAIKIIFDTKIKLKDMVGVPTTKKEAKAIVERIKDKSIGTKGFVVYSQDGSVGAGRKYLAQAIAGETKIPYVEINAVDFGTKDVDLFDDGNHSPEASMKKLFGMVKAQAETTPSRSAVLFIENFDYFSLGEMVSSYHEKAMSQLIREMRRAQEQGMNIVVMGSMNDPKNIGEATSKSFKFIDKIEVESPGSNTQARNEIIDYYIKQKGLKLAGDKANQGVIKNHINILTEHNSYIEILTLLDKAKNIALERKHRSIEKSDFTEAYLQLESGRPSCSDEPMFKKRITTSHECGHALNATIMANIVEKYGKPWQAGGKVNFITLDPRGTYGGAVYTTHIENKEWSFENLFAGIVCDFGGNSCEHAFYGIDGSWGITSDMAMATECASEMVSIMGQGKHFGKKSLNGAMYLSDEDKKLMDNDINVILKNAQLISDTITEIYADFNKEFTDKYAHKVGTGDCIIQREEFLQMLEDWKAKQSPEKQKEFELLDKSILDVIEATKNGITCHRV